MTKKALPVLAVCGYSGSGKTTLIEALILRLQARGLRLAVLKHDAHRLSVDTPGKDSARFFDAGAAVVLAHDPTQGFMRWRMTDDGPDAMEAILQSLPVDVDLVLVEGHKGSPWPKLWVGAEPPPPEVSDVVAVLPAGDARFDMAEQAVQEWLGESN